MVTLRDVARAAGVSAATASRALAAEPGAVATDRRERVLRAADELGYRRPGATASGPPSRRVGVIVPDMENPFFSGVVKGIGHRARDAGVTVFVADSDEDSRVEADLVRQLASQVDGLVLCSPRMSDDALAALPGDLAVVLLNREAPGLPSIVVDNSDGVRQALEHVHALGHRRIAYAGGPVDSWSDRERRRGLAAAVAALPDVDVVQLGHFPAAFSGGVAAADLVVATGASAVIAHNDLVALGVLDRLRARGVDVPGRVSVVGFDDVPAATQVSPALTTVGIPIRTLGRTAVDLLLELAPRPAGPRPTPQVRRIAVSLVVRGSTGPAPAPGPRTDLTLPTKAGHA
ncbi:LacI family DNA-binding transcriptional regulator [Cellulomonas aerilata]|uniref:LacI family transcriptional regulator n=1 Tax=Cellulomonas aerilata TaxID=515326 RepID=A0A512D8C8_9CELL|nr:LacI family DNA-binding transcriptional regulator [Cellulomonas aerilata]GEO32736.1 LacI family transcriptional regulator [Cellulomonas aerilata]